MALDRRSLAGWSVAAGISIALVVLRPAAAVTVSRGLAADSLNCNLAGYKTVNGLTAAVDQGLLVVTWTGQAGSELRARYAIDGGQPVVRDLAARKAAGAWVTLGRNLTPEYHVVSGTRRL